MSTVVLDASARGLTYWTPTDSATTHLYLYDNQLSRLPAAIGELQHLRVLDLADNALSDLTEAVGRLGACATCTCTATNFSTYRNR